MEFDINLILVPITLVFLVVFLVDKLWLKQHAVVKNHQKALKLADATMSQKHKQLQAVLVANDIKDDPTTLVANDRHAPVVVAAYNDYQNARKLYAQYKVKQTHEYAWVRWAYEFLPVLLFLVVVRAFVGEPFNIPSSSMVPSLHTGDFIVVNKSAYGLRLPITHTKILNTGSPKHGDVAVFRYPQNPKRYYIKRIIGLPNDTISFDNGVLSINGKAVPTTPQTLSLPDELVAKLYPTAINGQAIADDERISLGQQEEAHAHYYQEHLGTHTYHVRYLADLNSAQFAPFLQAQSGEKLAQSGGKSWQITIPEGQYFVMGDNRDRSEDGRFWGFVPETHLAGRATYIWMHKDAGLSMPTFGRVGRID